MLEFEDIDVLFAPAAPLVWVEAPVIEADVEPIWDDLAAEINALLASDFEIAW